MTVHSETVHTERYGAIGVIIVDNPPVNAIAPSVRAGIAAAAAELRDDPAVAALVLHCAGNTFMAGADLRKMGESTSRLSSAEVIQQLEDIPKPVLAALQGNALGGGLEYALGCHYRCAAASASLGLPEVNLGLIPGAGGTQRLPRLVGMEKALDMIISAKPVAAREALEFGLVDRILDAAQVLPEALAYARELVSKGQPWRKTRTIEVPQTAEEAFADAERRAARCRPREEAPLKAIQALRSAASQSFEEGMQREKELFAALRDSSQSRALRYLFMAERQVGRVPGVAKTAQTRPMQRVGVVGAGTMGRGIAMACADAGLEIIVLETNTAALEGAVDLKRLRDCDLVIEAIYEDLVLKQRLFADLEHVCKRGAILATTTSTLDIDAIASATSRPRDVIGLHFFGPAHVTRLVEVVRGRETAVEVMMTAMDFTKRLRKLGVLAGNCVGFIGNRMLAGYRREAEFLLLEGATPEQVDGALVRFGMPVGPHEMGGMAGLDIGAAARKRRRLQGPKSTLRSGARRRVYAQSRRHIADEEIVERCLLTLINEAARIVHERIALRPGDVDVVWVNGYGFPRYRGGPMCYADEIGLQRVLDSIRRFGQEKGATYWTPAPLLEQLVTEGRNLRDLN